MKFDTSSPGRGGRDAKKADYQLTAVNGQLENWQSKGGERMGEGNDK